MSAEKVVATLTGIFELREAKKHSIRYDDHQEDGALDNGYVSKVALAKAGVTAAAPQRIRYTLEVLASEGDK